MVGLVHPRVPVSPLIPPATSQSLTEEFPSIQRVRSPGAPPIANRRYSPESFRGATWLGNEKTFVALYGTYLIEVGPARRAGRSTENGRLGEPSLPSWGIDEPSSSLDYIQCSNLSNLFRFDASTFNASTFHIP